jgi:hypothetical protein
MRNHIATNFDIETDDTQDVLVSQETWMIEGDIGYMKILSFRPQGEIL